MGTLFWPQPLLAQEKTLRTLVVTGQGKKEIEATLVSVQLGIDAQGQTAQSVQEQVSQRSASVLNFLRSTQINKLKTTGINLSPNYTYENNVNRLVGYSASNSISFQLPATQLGSVLDQVVKLGTTRIDSISFSGTEEAIALAQQEALQVATKNAQVQAKAVLSSLNFAQQEIVGIQINGASVSVPLELQQFSNTTKLQGEVAGAPPEHAAPAAIQPGEQVIEATVTLQIRY